MGYGVLPFALEKDCLIAFSKSKKPTLLITHVNKLYLIL
jgi:hypothetical protein